MEASIVSGTPWYLHRTMESQSFNMSIIYKWAISYGNVSLLEGMIFEDTDLDDQHKIMV